MARPPITKKNPWTPKSGAFAGQTFHSERQYRNALARNKGFKSWHHQQRSPRKVTKKALGTFKPSQEEAYRRSLEALSHMRKGNSLKVATRKAGTTPNTVIKYAGSTLERGPGGRWSAKSSDRLPGLPMNVLTTEGLQFIAPRSRREASRIGEHNNAIRHFLATGDVSKLKKFKGKKVAGFTFETNPDKIEETGRKGELVFEDIYDKAA